MGEMNYTELDWREAILLGAALRDGLIEAVSKKARTAQEIADELAFDVRAVYVILAALEEQGILEGGPRGFRLRPAHKAPLMDAGSESYVGESVVHRFELMGSWSRITEVLQSGNPVEDRTSREFGGTATFIQAMRRGARPGADSVAAAVLPRLPAGARILDVGGGPGTNAEAFVRGGARVTVFDRPEVIELMRGQLSKAGVDTEAGDMNDALPEGPFDAIYFGNTSHMYGPKENRALFERMRGPLVSGGLLAIREFVRGMSEDAALFALNMLVTTSRGNTYTATEYEEWLRAAGFEDIEIIPVPGRGTHLILARNP
jgi:SAM-dependent methyltransferase